MRKRRTASLAFAGVSMFALAAALPVVAAEVTPERLINANKEPHNWLMNHRTYDAQRFSPLDAINEGNVKGLRLAYAVALGNSAGKEYNEATALAEDGFLYITDSWGVLYKIDVTSGDAGRIVWRIDAKRRGSPIALAQIHDPGADPEPTFSLVSSYLLWDRRAGTESCSTWVVAAHHRFRQASSTE